ncbi:MAG: hypothetical protein ACLP4W_29555 [Mycobacterium sp.]|uniref:hypothetical protein n=1 Tax=Mycobacterium sp. TaxID=1785 RepID=UPI003F9AA01B
MITLLINAYLCASGITMVVAFVCKRFCHQLTPRLLIRASLAVLVGALWPLLILGIVAFGCVVLLANVQRATNPYLSGAAQMQENKAGRNQPDDADRRPIVAAPR